MCFKTVLIGSNICVCVCVCVCVCDVYSVRLWEKGVVRERRGYDAFVEEKNTRKKTAKKHKKDKQKYFTK